MTPLQAVCHVIVISVAIVVPHTRPLVAAYFSAVLVLEAIQWALMRKLRRIQAELADLRRRRDALDELASTDQERGRYDEPINPLIK